MNSSACVSLKTRFVSFSNLIEASVVHNPIVQNIDGAEVVDLNDDFKNDNSLFGDIDHLNARGQMEFSKKMVTYIKSMK